ncbi:BRCT domain-containing protein [Fomitopsis serialis]|uniref:BRCT domain-containing protein n=1 Tax=Fomitopsis serialis TaxID=139415 RepID=UPI002007A6D6|nr:BRCT domain-containing protein [Neoantrodia serialis]KAH9935032.1 BRCT domain-containing protein [Neoantrodia serialis]
MRLCKLLEGDQVLVHPNQKAVVVDTSRFDSDRIVAVEIDNGEELDRLEVEIQDIKVASRTLNSAWTDRMLTVEDVRPVVRPHALKSSPSPSKMTLGSTASAKSVRRLLGKTGFVVTMSPRVGHWAKEKDRIMQAIKAVGGIVIDNWTDIFSMDGTYSQGNKRWVAAYKDISCIVRNDIQRVFLLSDDANAKPKYLIALALGIPCLDTNWVVKSVGDGKEKDWQQYLLPAGFCESLDARVSQLVDLDWGNSDEHLRDITGNQVASKLFANKRILCVAPDYVPIAKAKKNYSDAEKAKEAARMVPRIILTMGASSVEAVPDVKYASSKDLTEYDYIVVKDRGDIGHVASGSNCVHFGWVKDCLMAGRLLPQPVD